MAKLPNTYAYQSITNIYTAITTSYQDIATGASDDSDVFTLTATNSDGSDHILTVAINNGSDIQICEVTIPAHSGFSSLGTTYAPIKLIKDGLIPGLVMDSNGNNFFRLKSGLKIRMKGNTNLTVIGHQMNF